MGQLAQKSSDRKIAEHCGVDGKMVAKYRGQLESTREIPKSDFREGLDGRTTNTANIGSPEVQSPVNILSADAEDCSGFVAGLAV